MCEDCERPLDREVDFGLTAADFGNDADEHDDEILAVLASDSESEPEPEQEPDSTSTEASESKQCSICGKDIEDCNVHDHRGVLFEDPIDRAIGKMRYKKWRKEYPLQSKEVLVLTHALQELAPTKHGPRDGKSVYALRRECAEAGHRPSQLALARHTRTERRITPWRRTIGPFEFGILMNAEPENEAIETFIDETGHIRLCRYLTADPTMVRVQDRAEQEYTSDIAFAAMDDEEELLRLEYHYWPMILDLEDRAASWHSELESRYWPMLFGEDCDLADNSDGTAVVIHETAPPTIVARVPGEPSIAIFMPEDDEDEPVTCRVVGMDHEGAVVLAPADDEEDRRVGDDPDEHELALFV